MARLDGIPAQQRQVEPVTYNTLPSMRLLISFSELPLTQDLFPILISLVGPMPRLGVLSACWMLTLLCMARRSENLLMEVDGSCVSTELLINIASEFQLNSHDLDELVDGYERIDFAVEDNDDCMQLHRLASKLRDMLRRQEQMPSLPSPFYI